MGIILVYLKIVFNYKPRKSGVFIVAGISYNRGGIVMEYTAKIEQTRAYKKRMRYMPNTDTFEEKDCDSLSYIRNIPYSSGWIKESGTPPCEHLDVIVITDISFELGDEIPVRVIGVFCRYDGDNKLIAVPVSRHETDISELSDSETVILHRLYPKVGNDEGWFGKERAEKVITDFFSRKKRKIIITVQHTESVHHVNGHIGAWGEWDLTERGRLQAFEVGKWLLLEDCHRGFHMYCSDQPRAVQTAEEMNKSLYIKPVYSELIREVNAGEGNGKPRDWYCEHEAPKIGYDPDYKPFSDAESDRDLWNRITPFYRQIMESSEERVLVVSHGTTISFLHSMIMGYSFEDIERSGSTAAVGLFLSLLSSLMERRQPVISIIVYYEYIVKCIYEQQKCWIFFSYICFPGQRDRKKPYSR